MNIKSNWLYLALCAVFSICIALVTGFIENMPEASVSIHKYYGLPLYWRITTIFGGEEYRFFELFIDCVFWIAVVLVVALVAKKLSKD